MKNNKKKTKSKKNLKNIFNIILENKYIIIYYIFSILFMYTLGFFKGTTGTFI